MPTLAILDLDNPQIGVGTDPTLAILIDLALVTGLPRMLHPDSLAPLVPLRDKKPTDFPGLDYFYEHRARIFVSTANHISGRETRFSPSNQGIHPKICSDLHHFR